MAKKEKKQKTRFEDEQDQATGWGQTTQNSWGIPVAQPGWGVQEESDYEEETTWSNPPAGWGAETGASHWTNWGHSQSAQNIEPKFRTTPPTPTTHASPDQSPIMNALFSNPNVEKTSPPHQYNTPTNQQSVQKFQQPSHRQTMHPQQYGTTPSQWGTTWDDIAEEDEDGLSYADEEYGHPQAQDGYFPTASPYPISPSRTLSNALGSPGGGIPFDTPPVDIDSHNHNFIESQGAALSRAHRALYNQERTAKERLHWSFSPEKDERISSLLKWIEGMSDGVAALGVKKFIETQERGALFVNADFRPHQSPGEPAFDWVSIDQLKDTLDKILQESVALYDPASQVIVFAFLLSKSGNSMAIWRRRVPVSEVFRTMYMSYIDKAIANLQHDYPVYVEEIPIVNGKPTKQRRVLTKRKWWKPWSKKAAKT